MATVTLEEMQRDNLVMSAARALSLANAAAHAESMDPASCLVTLTEETATSGRAWRIHYGPRDYISLRGGDLIVVVDERSQAVTKIVRGQ